MCLHHLLVGPSGCSSRILSGVHGCPGTDFSVPLAASSHAFLLEAKQKLKAVCVGFLVRTLAAPLRDVLGGDELQRGQRLSVGFVALSLHGCHRETTPRFYGLQVGPSVQRWVGGGRQPDDRILSIISGRSTSVSPCSCFPRSHILRWGTPLPDSSSAFFCPVS